MKNIKKMSYFLIVLSSMIFSANNAYAVIDIFKIDFVKLGQSIAIWCQRQGDNFQRSLKEIVSKQQGSFTGKGIKAAKDAKAYADQLMEEESQTIQQEVKDSKEQKYSELSDLLASEK